MKELLITSSVLICVILLLRRVLRGRISLRLQYALWLLVAVRLLVPVSLFSSPVSVMNAVEAVGSARDIQVVQPLPPSGQNPGSSQLPAPDSVQGTGTQAIAPSAPADGDTQAPPLPTAGQVLRGIWLAGAAVMAIWLIAANLTFRRRLRAGAVPLAVQNCPLPVWLSPGAPAPCLTGLFRQAIWLPTGAAEEDRQLRHILTHELTHRRHLDPLWSLVRCLCLVIYWFHPLVWAAAVFSRRDCELACDEGALARLGEGERTAYGRTLLSLAAVRPSPADLLRPATTMTSGSRSLRERIVLIARRPRMMAVTALAVALIAALTVGCTFTAAQPGSSPAADLSPEEALAQLPEDLAEQVVLEADGGRFTYYYASDYGTDWGGLIGSLEQVTPVDFEQNYPSWEMTGGYTCLGRDDGGYYILSEPTDVSFDPAHQEGYRAAAEALTAWLAETLAACTGFTPAEEDPVYQAFQSEYTFPGSHVNVLFYPYYGLSGYEDKAEESYTLILSQPVTQGETGIWCVDRWYDSGGNLHYAVPETDLTMAEYYGKLQEECDQGHRPGLLDPIQAAAEYMEAWTGRSLSLDAFVLPKPYELPSETAGDAGAEAQAVLDQIMEGESLTMTFTVADSGEERTYTTTPDAPGNGRNRQIYFSESFLWSYAEEGHAPSPEPAYSLTVSSPDGAYRLQFWSDSELVRCTAGGAERWFTAAVAQPDDIFAQDVFRFMRIWYDEAEWNALTANLVIPDTGQSREEVAQAWAEAYTAAYLQLTPGSHLARSYVRTVTEVVDTPESWFGQDIPDYEHFRFTMDCIFVPADEWARSYSYAGNTVDYDADYQSRYGDAPEGALINFLTGPLYLTPEGWICTGLGTG